MPFNTNKTNDKSVVANYDKLVDIALNIESIINNIENSVNKINNLLDNTKYCWNDTPSDMLREDSKFDYVLARRVIIKLSRQKNDLLQIAGNYKTAEKDNANIINSLPNNILE